MRLPLGLTEDEIEEAARESMFGCGEYTGFCLKCGATAYGVEPDARNYKCDECGAMEVYGAEEVLLML